MPSPPLPTARPAIQRPLYRSGTGKKVFICDDDREFTKEMASALIDTGFNVRTLGEGNSPVEIFELFRPDIVFLDIFMPPPDGFEIMKHIGLDTRPIPLSLVLMSGDCAFLEVAAHFCKARNIATTATLHKPLNLGQVLKICQSHGRKDEANCR